MSEYLGNLRYMKILQYSNYYVFSFFQFYLISYVLNNINIIRYYRCRFLSFSHYTLCEWWHLYRMEIQIKSLIITFCYSCSSHTFQILNIRTPEMIALTEQGGYRVYSSAAKRCRRNGKQWGPWSDCAKRSLIRVCTFCSCLSVPKLRTFTVL